MTGMARETADAAASVLSEVTRQPPELDGVCSHSMLFWLKHYGTQ